MNRHPSPDSSNSVESVFHRSTLAPLRDINRFLFDSNPPVHHPPLDSVDNEVIRIIDPTSHDSIPTTSPTSSESSVIVDNIRQGSESRAIRRIRLRTAHGERIRNTPYARSLGIQNRTSSSTAVRIALTPREVEFQERYRHYRQERDRLEQDISNYRRRMAYFSTGSFGHLHWGGFAAHHTRQLIELIERRMHEDMDGAEPQPHPSQTRAPDAPDAAAREERDRLIRELEQEDEHSPAPDFTCTCGVCKNEKPSRRAVFTACGHAVCRVCAEKLARVATDESKHLSCPLCRVKTGFVPLFEDRVIDADN